MKLFNIHVITCNSVSEFNSKFKKKMMRSKMLKSSLNFTKASKSLLQMIKSKLPC